MLSPNAVQSEGMVAVMNKCVEYLGVIPIWTWRDNVCEWVIFALCMRSYA